MATLIHKLNLLLLEFEQVFQLKTSLQLIFSNKLLSIIVDFCMNTDNFANFGIRFLEILSLQFCDEILNTQIMQVVAGLLRTNDYETCAQCLSFIAVVADNQVLQGKDLALVINKKLISLILKTVSKQTELEYLHYMISIVNHCFRVTELRHVIMTDVLHLSEQEEHE